jgi:hypothetical protein
MVYIIEQNNNLLLIRAMPNCGSVAGWAGARSLEICGVYPMRMHVMVMYLFSVTFHC